MNYLLKELNLHFHQLNIIGQLKENDKFGIDFSISGNNKLFFDVIYNPFNTDFSEAGNKSGNIIENGLNMFLFQAQKAFLLWNKINPNAEDLKNKLKK